MFKKIFLFLILVSFPLAFGITFWLIFSKSYVRVYNSQESSGSISGSTNIDVSNIAANNPNQGVQEEIIANSEKHKDDFKSLSQEKTVIVTTYFRELFDRTEYALGIKYSDFKNLEIMGTATILWR